MATPTTHAPFLGEIRIVPFNFAPKGWALCDGQLLPINQNTALFSLLGTSYGGDGKATFALPNLQGRTPIKFGTGGGLSSRALGETGGIAAVILNDGEIPQHNHAALAVAAAGNQIGPTGHATAEIRGGSYAGAANAQMSPLALAAAGGGAAHNNMPPYLTLTFVIAMQGIFPAQS